MISSLKFEFNKYEIDKVDILLYGEQIPCFQIGASNFIDLEKHSRSIGHSLFLRRCARAAREQINDFVAVYVLTNSKTLDTYCYIILDDMSGLILYEEHDEFKIKKTWVKARNSETIIWKTESGLEDVHKALLCSTNS